MDLNTPIRELLLDEPELAHAAAKSALRNAVKKNFKYVAKVDLGKTTRYFYTNEEYQAYLKDSKASKDTSTNKTAPTASTAKSTTTSTKRKPLPGKMGLAGMIRAGLKSVEEQTKKAEKIAEDAKKKAEENEKKKAEIAAKEAEIKAKEAEIKADTEPDEKPAEPEMSQKDKTHFADTISSMNSPKSFDELDRKDTESSHDEDQAATNPNHLSYADLEYLTDEERAIIEEYEENTGIGIEEYQTNCESCTVVYDFRRRGYDVEAAPYDMNETWRPNMEGVSQLYKGVTEDDWTSVKADDGVPNNFKGMQVMLRASDELDKMPDGSYGQFNVGFWTGGAHSVIWEKNDGKVTLRDCQSDKTYAMDEIIDSDNIFKDNVDVVRILRTDDKEFSDEALKRVRNVSDENPIAEIVKAVKARAAAGGPTPKQLKEQETAKRKEELEKLERELEEMRKESERLQEEMRKLEEKRRKEAEEARRRREELNLPRQRYDGKEVSMK